MTSHEQRQKEKKAEQRAVWAAAASASGGSEKASMAILYADAVLAAWNTRFEKDFE